MTKEAPAQLAPEDDALLEKLAAKAVRWGMGVPAIFMLESVKPLNFIGSQVLIFFGPLVTAFFKADDYMRLSALLERRETLELLIVKVERLLNDEAAGGSVRK